MKSLHLVIVLLAFAYCPNEALSNGKAPCSQDDARLAEIEASSLKTWDAIYKSFQRFSQCDDAAIGEGYSDSIARMLSENWSDTHRLQQLVLHDRRFEIFVKHHIDQLMTPSQAATIARNAAVRCPEGANVVCGLILKRLREISSLTPTDSERP